MTAIVGIRWDGGALLAGDSAGCVGDTLYRERAPKVAHGDGYLVGAAGDAVACATAIYDVELVYDGSGLSRWAHALFAPRLRELLAARVRSDEDLPLCVVLLAAPGELTVIGHDGGAVDLDHDYMAIGGGGDVALGALAVSARRKPASRARQALAVASRHSTVVLPPWNFVTCDGGAGEL